MTKEEINRLCAIERRVQEMAEEEELLTTTILFELVSSKQMIEAMAYRFSTNFSHWSFGRDYERERTIYEHTGGGIPYEVVWNYKMPQALLVETNPFALNALIVAHVYGHVDYFLGNAFLKHGRFMDDIAAEARRASERFSEYERRHSAQLLERVIDAGFSIQWHQDPDPFSEDIDEEELREYLLAVERAKLEPDKSLASEFRKLPTEEEVEVSRKKLADLAVKTPPMPMYDILRYVILHSPKPLKPWMKDVLETIRMQARQLNPNRMTKILNEGWASYWHRTFVRRLFQERLLTPDEFDTCITSHAAVTQANPIRMNPYNLGLSLFDDVKERWDKGQFGRAYRDCEDPYQRLHWDTHANKGKGKILDVRSRYSDRMAFDEFLTPDFIRQQMLYVYGERENPQTGDVEVVILEDDPDVMRQILLSQLPMSHIPSICVTDGNFKDNRELYLVHDFSGQELDPHFESGALENIYFLWGRPVHLETTEIVKRDEDGNIKDTKKLVHTYDGAGHSFQHKQ